MANENIHTYDNGFHPKEVKLKDNYKFYNKNIIFRFFSRITATLANVWLIFPKLFMGYKIIGKKNFKKINGAILISNHIHFLDAFFIVSSLFYKKIYVTMLQSNLGFGLVSKYIRLAAAVPIPNDTKMFRKFSRQTSEALDRKANILFYPEAALMPYCDHIRNFLPGAFHFAVKNNAPIIPCCFTFHKPKGLYKLFRKKPLVHFNILEPYYLNENDNNEIVAEKLNKLISEYFNEHSDYYK